MLPPLAASFFQNPICILLLASMLCLEMKKGTQTSSVSRQPSLSATKMYKMQKNCTMVFRKIASIDIKPCERNRTSTYTKFKSFLLMLDGRCKIKRNAAIFHKIDKLSHSYLRTVYITATPRTKTKFHERGRLAGHRVEEYSVSLQHP